MYLRVNSFTRLFKSRNQETTLPQEHTPLLYFE